MTSTKEKKPCDPAIREKFNTFRFADHKESMFEMLPKIVRVSVETNAITDAMGRATAIIRSNYSSPIRSAAINASCGMLTLPYSRIRALPFFCFSSSFFLRVMSPP